VCVRVRVLRPRARRCFVNQSQTLHAMHLFSA
jgi:hypothetical protein